MVRKTMMVVCACAASTAMAQDFDGVYRQVANADCALIGVDGGALEIKNGVFYGVDSSCRMTNPVSVINMEATLYNMECSGEGTQWSERAMFLHKAEGDGIIAVWNGYAFVYDRCPDPSLTKD